jgi:carbonic anhydrase
MVTSGDSFPDRLLAGYQSFREKLLPEASARYRILADSGQRPQIMIIGCCDSRAAPETIFDAGPGELFVLRNVANLVPPYDPDGEYHGTSAAIEFAVVNLKVRHIVVMGHGRCGGVEAMLATRDRPGDFIGKWISLLEPAMRRVGSADGDGAARQRALEFASIRQGIENLKTFPAIADLSSIGEIELHGAWFDISTGELLVLDRSGGSFDKIA